MNLTNENKKLLLKLARDTIQAELENRDISVIKPDDPIFKEKRGAFVTLHIEENLRGCIGYIEGYKPIFETIIEMAKSAAFNDPRFPPLEINEIKKLDIEISILSPLTTIKNINKIKVGIHGLIIIQGANRGLLLPQVATEQKWELTKFLEHTCLKAGLSPNAYKDESTEIQIFSAEIFSE